MPENGVIHERMRFVRLAASVRALLQTKMAAPNITEAAIIARMAELMLDETEEHIALVLEAELTDEERMEARLSPRSMLEFPVEKLGRFGRYSFETKWRVLLRTSKIMHAKRELVTPSSLAARAHPYLPEMKAKSLESFISTLDNEFYLQLKMSTPRLNELDDSGFIPSSSTSTYSFDGGSSSPAEATSEAAPTKKKSGPFSMFGDDELGIIRRGQEAMRRVAQGLPPLDTTEIK